MDDGSITLLVALLILVALSAFFSASETAYSSLNQIRLKSRADAGDKQAARVLMLSEHFDSLLSTILIGNNIVNISATALTTVVAINLFGNAYVGAATAVLTLLILIFGEITPKNMAAVNAEKISLEDAGIIRALMIIFRPVIFIIDKISRGILILRGVNPDARPSMTENELRTLVDVSQQEGVIEKDESEMINNVVDFGDTIAEEIMIPRIDVTAVPDDISYDGLIDVFREHRFTRLPVYRNKVDNVVGIINMKDLLVSERTSFSMENVMKEPYFTYEKKGISDLLDEMRLNSLSIVVVLNEYGAASGIITMEDILEEIVGDIHDEYKSRDAEEITEIAAGKEYSCLGSVSLDDLNDRTGLNLNSEEYDSIGGYVIEHSEDELPKVGEYVVTEEGAKLIVEAVRRNRIMRVHVYLPPAPEEE